MSSRQTGEVRPGLRIPGYGVLGNRSSTVVLTHRSRRRHPLTKIQKVAFATFISLRIFKIRKPALGSRGPSRMLRRCSPAHWVLLRSPRRTRHPLPALSGRVPAGFREAYSPSILTPLYLIRCRGAHLGGAARLGGSSRPMLAVINGLKISAIPRYFPNWRRPC